MIGLKSNKVRDVYLWFKKGIKAVSDERECTAVADEVFLRVLNMPRDQRVLKADERLSETNLVRLIKAQKRLNNHEPVQYVTGVAAFRGLLFRVRPGVLIPRQETEGLVDLVIRMTDEDRERPQYTHSFLDIGTGSGCIAISLKAALPDHPVSACDYDDMILELAGSNAADNNTSVDFFRCNIFMRDGSGLKNRLWDYIVSNPPYVRESEKSGMSPQVLDHEPGYALFVPDDDPLVFYRELAGAGTHLLRPGGRMFLEINEALSEECEQLFVSEGFVDVLIHKDIHGKDRYLSARFGSYSS